MLVISCHADTAQKQHQCFDDGEYYRGNLDNFVGVYSVMKAYFSGRLVHEHMRIELTYGEEDEEYDFEGAYNVLDTLRKHDVVIVVDVTGTRTQKDFVVEKCDNRGLRKWLKEALCDHSFEIYENCPDPIADEDEADVYKERLGRVLFMGIPCIGGDYNLDVVSCKKSSVTAVSEAICRLSETFPEYCRSEGIPST